MRQLLLMLAIMPVILFAQPRVNGKGPAKIEKVSQVVNKPVGWCYDEWATHKWCGWRSVIWAKYLNNDKNPRNASVAQMGDSQEDDRYYDAGGPRNIISLQMKRMRLDTIPYYLLYLQSWYFYFDYPYLRKGIHYKKATHVYLLSEIEYQKIWNLDTGMNVITFLDHNVFDGDVARGERSILIYYNNNNIPKQEGSPFRWYIKKEDDNTLRFQAPTRFSLKGKPRGWSGDFQIDFEHSYFEMSASSFNMLKIK